MRKERLDVRIKLVPVGELDELLPDLFSFTKRYLPSITEEDLKMGGGITIEGIGSGNTYTSVELSYKEPFLKYIFNPVFHQRMFLLPRGKKYWRSPMGGTVYFVGRDGPSPAYWKCLEGEVIERLNDKRKATGDKKFVKSSFFLLC